MKSKKNLIITTSIISILIVVAALFFIMPGKDKAGNKSLKLQIPDNKADKKIIYLYFTDQQNNFLLPENHQMEFDTNTRKFAQNLISKLLKGPLSKELMSPIPEKTKLLSLYIDDNQTAVLDFSSEIRENHPGGSQSEILTIYSIVNTLTLNIDEIKNVKLLINGNESDTLAGHIALRFPLKENLTIIK